MPQSLSLTITTQSLYTMTIDQVLVVCMPYRTSRGRSREPLAYATTYAYNVVACLPLLKLAAFSRVVLNSIELLMTIISLQMFYVHLVASQICQSISLIIGCYSTLLMSTIVDVMYSCTIFHSTQFCLPLSIAYSQLHASLRYVACLLMCLGPLFTYSH